MYNGPMIPDPRYPIGEFKLSSTITPDVRNEAILRSDAPSRDGALASYFEIRLYGLSKAVVRRYSADTKAGTTREQVAFAITHDALSKLAADIAA